MAWRSLLVLLASLALVVALTGQNGSYDPSGFLPDTNEDQVKSWGTMDGKSPFRLIAGE